MDIKQSILTLSRKAINSLYNQDIEEKLIQIQGTRKEFEGNFTVVVFPLLRYSRKSPEQTANEIGKYLIDNNKHIIKFNVIKGFLNLSIAKQYWISFLDFANNTNDYGIKNANEDSETILVEYSSPNTNKPLHLGHIRNNLLGYSLAQLLKANGYKVYKTNIVNDRGIHICKSMLAWKNWANGETPESANLKGDHLVGKYYVMFDTEYKKEIKKLVAEGKTLEEAKKEAPLICTAQRMLRKWEHGNKKVHELWKNMNSWVYLGFDETYKKLGVDFDKIYYESDTYQVGKSIVLKAMKEGLLEIDEDDSVWANLKDKGLERKLLLRSDGTSVYMTQDLGTAKTRFDDYKFDKHIYVVGNEQDYHFKVLSIVLEKLGYEWHNRLQHMSYGMVELPEGKMKSREGTVVDADDLIAEMENTAKETSMELGKLDDYSENEKQKVFRTIAMGALKYFILKVDLKKNMTFNPKESIDFNGNTGPFIQYTYVRIQSVIRKAKDSGIEITQQLTSSTDISDKEISLIKLIYDYPEIVNEAGINYSPAMIANYVYEIAKEYNQFYHDHYILKENNEAIKQLRLVISQITGKIIKSAMNILGIDVPERM